MNLKISRRFLVFSVLLMLLTGSPRLLPAYERQELIDSAAVIVRVSDVSDFITAIAQSGLGQLWNSNEMKPFIQGQSLAEALKETFLFSVYGEKTNYKELAHLSWEELKLLNGELVVGFSPPDPEGKSGFFIVAAMSPPAYLKTLDIDERMAELDEGESAPRKQVFQGVDVFRLDRTVSPGVTQSEWSAFYGGTLLSGSSQEWVERCLVRLKKELPSAPAVPPTLHVGINNRFIAYMFEQQAAPPGEESWADGAEEGEGDEEGRGTPDPPVPPSVIFNALGLDQLQGAALDLILKPGSMDFQLIVNNSGKGELKGLWTLLTREPVPPKHQLAYVPGDVYNYQVMRLDLNALWKELPGILKAINPQLAMKLQGITGIFSGAYQVDLSRDVFGNLGTLVTSFSRMDGPKKQELLAWQLRDPEAMEKLLVKLLGESSPLKARFQDWLEISDLQGHKLYSFKTIAPEPRIAPAQQPNAPMPQSTYTGISVVDGALVFGPDQLVRSLIQAGVSGKKNLNNSLYQAPYYTRLLSQVPGDATGYTITDISLLLQPLLQFFKRTWAADPQKREGQEDNGKEKTSPLTEFIHNLQFERLPTADFIASFFGKGISYVRFDGDKLVSRGIFQYREKK
jgi:hypothetical protein